MSERRPWESPDEDEPEDTTEAWRGDVHLDDWPEQLAGPEYWSGNGEEGDLRKRYPPKDTDGEEGE